MNVCFEFRITLTSPMRESCLISGIRIRTKNLVLYAYPTILDFTATVQTQPGAGNGDIQYVAVRKNSQCFLCFLLLHLVLFADDRGFHVMAMSRTEKNSKSPSHGIHAGIAGSTDTFRTACAVWLPQFAMTYAVTVCGAAAGVTSTVRVVPSTPCLESEHSGVIDVLKPELGKPSTLKQICAPPILSGLMIVTLIFAFSPTLIVTEEG
jgi:hypothetical protein